MRKRFVTLLTARCLALCCCLPLLTCSIRAEQIHEFAPEIGSVNMAASQPLNPLLLETPRYPLLYPCDIREVFGDDNRRQIIKTYELKEGDNPAGIPQESFERDDWRYELMDITKKETASVASRKHVEVLKIDVASRDIEDILPLLSPAREVQTADGYYGFLAIDIGSITVETAGSYASEYTLTAMREYPHMSGNDTALIPKTITEQGVIYTLSGVDWNAQTTATIDHAELPASYTATALYTASATRTVITGYTVTAEYRGTVARVLPATVVYTAYFQGVESDAIATKRTGAMVLSSITAPGIGSVMFVGALGGVGYCFTRRYREARKI